MVEKILEKADGPISRNEIKRRLPKQIMHQTLNLVLGYLEKSGKIMVGSRGILWIFNEDKKFKKMLEKAREI